MRNDLALFYKVIFLWYFKNILIEARERNPCNGFMPRQG